MFFEFSFVIIANRLEKNFSNVPAENEIVLKPSGAKSISALRKILNII